MNDLIISTSGQNNQPTMSSKEVAALTGKLHKNVLRDIRKMYADLGISPGSNLSQDGYELSKEDCLILVSGYNVKLRAKIIKRWIELETAQQPQIPQTFAEALQLAANQAKQLELQAPKVEFADSIIKSEGSVSIGDFAKIYGKYGRNILFRVLRGEKILMNSNVPYQTYINEGYFEVTETNTPVGVKVVTRLTGKGQAWLTKRLNKLDN